jgi:hypothetical protein
MNMSQPLSISRKDNLSLLNRDNNTMSEEYEAHDIKDEEVSSIEDLVSAI